MRVIEGTIAVAVVLTTLVGAFSVPDAGGHGAVIRLGAQAVAAGDSLAVTGEGLGERAEITLALEGAAGRTILATLRGDAHGRFETAVVIPVQTPAGTYRIVAEAGEERATADLLVTAAADGNRAEGSPVPTRHAEHATAEEMRLERHRSVTETALAWGLVGTLVLLGVWLARGAGRRV